MDLFEFHLWNLKEFSKKYEMIRFFQVHKSQNLSPISMFFPLKIRENANELS